MIGIWNRSGPSFRSLARGQSDINAYMLRVISAFLVVAVRGQDWLHRPNYVTVEIDKQWMHPVFCGYAVWFLCISESQTSSSQIFTNNSKGFSASIRLGLLKVAIGWLLSDFCACLLLNRTWLQSSFCFYTWRSYIVAQADRFNSCTKIWIGRLGGACVLLH